MAALSAHLGLVVFTLVALALAFYLIYAMIHPEKF
ncbi:MAG TPA: potassium-transporting ATPase subunit F [Thermoplasmata archaeon]|nr:potassium-transporting ATPase subunit F [Thermoplasmata archaeon]